MNSAPSVGSSAIRSVKWVALDKWVGRLTTFAVFIVLGRLVPPTAFGLIALASVVVTVLQSLINSGLARSVVQQRELTDLDKHTTFWTTMAVSTALFLGVFATAPLLASAYDEPDLTWVLRALSTSLIFAAASAVPAALLERDFGFRALALRRLSGNLGGGVLGIVLAAMGAGVWALVAQTVGTSLVSFVVLLVHSPWRPGLKFSRASFRSSMSYSTTVLIGELLVAVNTQFDKIIIGAFLGTTALGYYYFAFRIVSIVVELVTGVFGQLSFATFARLQDDERRRSNGFRLLAIGSSLTTIPALGLAAVLSTDLLQLAYGSRWDRSAAVLSILALSSAIAVPTSYDRPFLLSIGKPGVALRQTASRAVIGTVVLVLMAPLGLLGMTWSRVIRDVIFWPTRLITLHRSASVPWASYTIPFVRLLLISTVAASTAWASLHLLPTGEHIGRVALGTAVYGVVGLALLATIARRDLNEATSTLRRVRRSASATT